nr:ECF transporter S component [Lachnospiraceae bacterium]
MKSIAIGFSKIKTKTVAVLLAIAAAVILPQLAHLAGAALGVGSSVGEMFLPMQFPVLFVGALMGPAAGLVTGVLSPLVSHVLTGMPVSVMLPFIMLELGVYGLASGLMKSRLCKPAARIFVAQVAGRAARTLAMVGAFYFQGSSLPLRAGWTYITAGIWGIVIQLLVLPVLLALVEKKRG